MVLCHQTKELKCFRSFTNFDQEKFTEDLNKIEFDKITDQNDVNKIYSDFEEAFIQTLLVINSLIVGQNSFDLGPPIHLSKK
jgi:hypothetical protein